MKSRLLKHLIAAVSLSVFVISACSDITDMENRLDSLESKVQALETVITSINSNIESVAALASGSCTINSVTEDDGVYTIVLSNGEEIVLTQGTIGVGNAPVMSVDKDGYWMVDYGQGPEYIYADADNTKKIMAYGSDGVTPVFGVDSKGFWTVSYDRGKTYAQVKDSNGQPVPAVSDGAVASGQFFKDVTYEDDVFTLTLGSGEVITVPVVASFLFSISGNDELELFAPGQTKSYAIESKGVVNVMVTLPDGWNYTLSETAFALTAPVAVKSVIADSESDVSILAVSAQGYVSLSKLNVELSNKPHVIVKPGAATHNSLEYTVETINTTVWKYLHLPASETAPDASRIESEGTEGTGNKLTVTGLQSETEYVLYILPMNAGEQGKVASASNSTIKEVIIDLYQAYLDGKVIEIAGVKYSKATHGDAVLVTAAEPSSNTLRTPVNKKTGIFFLETSAGADFTFSSNITFNKTADGEDMVLIGRYLDREQVIKPASFIKAVSGGLVLHNLVIDFSTLPQNYLIVNNCAEDQSKLHIDACTFKNVKYHMYSVTSTSYANYIIKDIVITGSIFDFADNDKILFNFGACTGAEKIESFTFTDNILCNSAGGTRTCQIVQFGSADYPETTEWNTTYAVSNNIFYNVLSSSNTFFKIHQTASVKMNRNIFWAPLTHGSMSYIWNIMKDSQPADAFDLSDNIAYGMIEGKSWSAFSSGSAFRFESGNSFAKTESDPFSSVNLSTYTFTTKDEFKSYGVQN